MMFVNPGEMFIGSLSAAEQKYLHSILIGAKAAGYERVIEPCSGTLAMANLAVETGWKTSQIESSDVAMMPTILGYSIMGKSLEDLEIKAQGFTAEELNDPATALYAQLYLRMVKNAGVAYFYNILQDLRFNREKHIEKIRVQLENAAKKMRGINYRPLCMYDHLAEVLDDDKAIVIVNPPTYFSGYEKYYDTNGMMTWKEPKYELFDPETGHGKLFGIVENAKALVLCYQEKPPGMYSGEAIYARAATRADLNAYICSNRGEEAVALADGKKIKRRNESGLEALPCKVIPLDYNVTPESSISIAKVTAANSGYYRKLWAHNIIGSSATYNFGVFIDGMLAGVFGLSKMSMDSMFIWYVMKAPHKTMRLGRLVYMLAKSRTFLNTITNDFERVSIKTVRTAMLTKYPENKEVRGIMKLKERKKDKEYGYKLTYEAPIVENTDEKSIFDEWKERENKWNNQRSSTK